MTPASIAMDAKVVDTRDRQTGRGAADSQSAPSPQAFDGILSGLTEDATTTVALSGQALPTLTAAAAVLVPKVAQADASVIATIALPGDTDPITALVGKIIGKSEPLARTTSDTESSGKDETPSSAAVVATDSMGSVSQSALPADLAALLASPLRTVSSGQADLSVSAKASASVAQPKALPSGTVNSASSLDAEPGDATQTIANVAVETRLAPWTEASTGATPVTAKHTTDQSSTTLPSMAGQIRTIANGVLDLVKTDVPTVAPSSAPQTTVASLAPARTLTLQLTPPDLGTVAIRLHLTGDTLDIQLSVSEPQTLGLLARDRDALSSAIGNQSYQVHSLVIQGMDASASASGGNNAGQNDKNGATHGGMGRDDDRGSGDGSRQDQPSRQQSQPKARSSGGSAADGGASSGQLFV